MPENNHSAERYWLIALVLVTATICLGSLNAPLVEPTEARYALIAADMLENDSWFIPYLNGEPYLDKPPLLYWAIMSVYRL
ncbi:MAG: ArnT family glycosyltransferase, partial [Planctomycetota bacterium]